MEPLKILLLIWAISLFLKNYIADEINAIETSKSGKKHSYQDIIQLRIVSFFKIRVKLKSDDFKMRKMAIIIHNCLSFIAIISFLGMIIILILQQTNSFQTTF